MHHVLQFKRFPRKHTKKKLRKTLRVALVTISEDVFSEVLRVEAHICLQTAEDSKKFVAKALVCVSDVVD